MNFPILFALLISFPKIYGMASDDDLVFNNSMGMILTSSEYCFLNESTIRINDFDVNIINNTGDWIMASNNVDLFMAPANGTNCTLTTSSVAPYSDTVYIIQIILYSVLLVTTTANVTLHLFIKELQTVSGLLITSLCSSMVLNIFVPVAYLSLTDQRNGNACAVLLYIIVYLYFIYEVSKLSALIQFAYLMYQSYKTSEISKNTKSILCKYAIFIGLLSTICSASFILIDALTSKTAFKTTHGRCTLSNDPSNYETASITLLIVQLSIFNITEVSLMVAGLILYFLTTRRCCSTLTRDVKISVALNSTIGFNTGIIVILYILQVSADVSYSCSTVGTIIEQVLLFLVFFTTNKVLSKFQCTHIVIMITHCLEEKK